MHTFTLHSTLFACSVLAAPKPIANQQYNNPAPAVLSTLFVTSVVVVTTTVGQLPSSTNNAIETVVSTGSLTLQPSSTPTPEALAGVYICDDINWAGTCTHRLTALGTAPEDCTQLNGTASSIGPDEGFACIFYTNSFCDKVSSNRTDFIEVTYPGIEDLRNTAKGDLNDSIWSYLCLRRMEMERMGWL